MGDEKTKRADVRIIAATNRNLRQEVEAGRFREDLYYRLNVFPVQVALLRERREDIPLLAKYFVEMLAKELKCPKPRCIVLQKTGWKIKGADGAAELLGIKPTTLISRIKKMGLR